MKKTIMRALFIFALCFAPGEFRPAISALASVSHHTEISSFRPGGDEPVKKKRRLKILGWLSLIFGVFIFFFLRGLSWLFLLSSLGFIAAGVIILIFARRIKK